MLLLGSKAFQGPNMVTRRIEPFPLGKADAFISLFAADRVWVGRKINSLFGSLLLTNSKGEFSNLR